MAIAKRGFVGLGENDVVIMLIEKIKSSVMRGIGQSEIKLKKLVSV
jgi:hypothetical protein